MRKSLTFVFMVLTTFTISFLLGLSTREVIALTAFLAIVYGTLLFWRFRLAFGLLGITVLLAAGLIDIHTLIEYAGVDIILFLMGMMIVIGFLEERHFFEYIIDKIVEMVGPRGYRLVAVMMILSALFAALVDEVTSILFMSATMIHLAVRLKLNPIPFVIMLIFATNIGSSATVVGNPVGVMIALRGGLTFIDFLRWATPISILSLAIVIPLSMYYFSGDIRRLDEHLKLEVKEEKKIIEGRVLTSGKELIISTILFLGTITFLILHSFIEEVLHLEKNTMLLGTALGAASIALLIEYEKAKELVERRVDWWTLAFFMMLFAKVGTLSYVGLTERIASSALSLGAIGGEFGILMNFTWIMGVLSALMDNVLAVAIAVPIIHELSALGVHVFPFWWAGLFSATFFGNLTMIGSTANIVAIGMIERRKLGHVTMGYWIKPGILASVIPLLLAILLLYLQYPIIPI
ncbi:MAG: SLC13 family permease [Nitrososphaerales archaeon]